MAGPVASLLLREPLSQAEIAELDGWLKGISHITQVQKSPDNKYSADFWVDKLPHLQEILKNQALYLPFPYQLQK